MLAEFLARKNWEDSERTLTSITPILKKEIAADFINEDKDNIFELIGGMIMVQDYKKYDALIFVYNYIQEHGEGKVTSLTFRILKTKLGMKLLEEEDVVFDFKEVLTKEYYGNKVKNGRLSRPKSESIQKTIEIKKYIEANQNITMDTVCQEFGFSKTTYYRVLKWLEHRNN